MHIGDQCIQCIHRMKNVDSVQHGVKIWNEIQVVQLQRHCDEPIDVPVKNWGGVKRDLELTHAKLMHCGDQSNQCTECTDVHGCFPELGVSSTNATKYGFY